MTGLARTALVLATALVAHANAATYSIVPVEIFEGANVASTGEGLNNRGEVVGTLEFGIAYIHGPEGTKLLGLVEGTKARALAVNDKGTVVGLTIDRGREYLTLWRDGRLDIVETPSSVVPYAINNDEVIVGATSVPPSGLTRGFVVANGTFAMLPTLGGLISIAYGIDGLGRIVGGATDDKDAQQRAVMWTAGGAIVDLGTVGGRVAAAHAINARGQVVGDSLAAENYFRHAFLYENGVIRDLLPDPTRYSDLLSINASGDAVGNSHLYRGGRLTPWAQLVNPYTSWTFAAKAINDAGLIMGNGCRAGVCNALLLVPLKAPPPPPAGQVNVIEYHHAGLDHFFMTALTSEIDALDSGAKAGWERTGEHFRAYPSAGAGTSPVCRFYIPPEWGDSHFFSASPAECADTRAKFPHLVPETDQAFFIAVPDGTGRCEAGSTPVYRLWSPGAGSNHRYTTDPGVRDNMAKAGWIVEGNGPDRASMCVPG